MRIALLSWSFLLLPALAYAQIAPETLVAPWPPANKAFAIAGCKKGIADNAMRDYKLRNNLQELSPSHREELVRVIEPVMAASCNCVFDRLEKQFAFEQLATSPEVTLRMRQLVAGECSIQRLFPREPEHRS